MTNAKIMIFSTTRYGSARSFPIIYIAGVIKNEPITDISSISFHSGTPIVSGNVVPQPVVELAA